MDLADAIQQYVAEDGMRAFCGNHPLLSIIQKPADRIGAYINVPIDQETTQGRSISFARAPTNQTLPRTAEFMVPVARDREIVPFSRMDLMESARVSLMSILPQISTGLSRLGDRVSSDLFRQGPIWPHGRFAALGQWIPDFTPDLSDNFMGVNRSVDSRLYGNYYDGTGLRIEESIIGGAALAYNEGGNIDYGFCNPAAWRALERELAGRLQRVTVQLTRGDSFDAIRLMGDGGRIDVLADNSCPADVIWLLDLNSWRLPMSIAATGADGDVFHYEPVSDRTQVALHYYGNLTCSAPAHNVQVKTRHHDELTEETASSESKVVCDFVEQLLAGNAMNSTGLRVDAEDLLAEARRLMRYRSQMRALPAKEDA